MKNSLFIFGLGYTATALAARLQAQGWHVAGTCRTKEKCDTLRIRGIEAVPFNEVSPLNLEYATHILSSIPPGQEERDPVLPRFAELLTGHHRWMGYLSTTGVYGDHNGAWVDEDTPPRPNNARLERRVEAEKIWLAAGASVFRLAGIYGPDRNALCDIMDGTAKRINKEGQVFSRIHVDDIAGIVHASMLAPNPGCIYNVCDDEPAPAHEVVAYAAELLGREPPPLVPFEHAELSPMAQEFYSANRRVRNTRMKEELGYALRYPTYREGLQALKHAL